MILDLYCKNDSECEEMKYKLLNTFGDFIRVKEVTEVGDDESLTICLSCNVPESITLLDIIPFVGSGNKAYLTPGVLD